MDRAQNTETTKDEKSFLDNNFYLHSLPRSGMCVVCVCVCVFLHPSDVKLRFHRRKEKGESCAGCESSAALREGRAWLWPLLWFLLHCVAAGEALELVDRLCQKVWKLEARTEPSEPRRDLPPDSRASTTVYHHGGDLAVDDLLLSVKVEHVDGRHLGGGTAGARGPSGVGFVHQVGVRVLLQVHVLTLPGAIVGLVALWGNNPVPTKVFEVHRERVAAAPGLWRVLVTVQARVSPDTLGPLWDLHLHERLLQRQNGVWILRFGRLNPSLTSFSTFGSRFSNTAR